jgi:hypothetical protein
MVPIKLFEQKKVRTHFDNEKEIWYFSVIDVIEILTDSSIPKRYWSDLKKKLIKEGSQLYEKIVQLKFDAADGKRYASDCLETRDLLRLIQSIPSPKAEPFKQWLAKTGYERMQEISDPSQSIDRARENRNNLRFTNDDLRITIPYRTSYHVYAKSQIINRTS